MNTFYAKRVTVQAERFLQHKRPWPEAVETIYANGIPEPRVGDHPIRNYDWIVAVNGRVVVLPDSAFLALFDVRDFIGESVGILERRITDLEADLRAAREIPGIVTAPVTLLPEHFDVKDGAPDEGQLALKLKDIAEANWGSNVGLAAEEKKED